MQLKSPKTLALFEALFVSLIWASSFIFVKLALTELGPLTIGGLRYFLGFACLLPFLRRHSFSLTGKQWLSLALLGVSGYTLANGALFWALRYLPATTGSFLMSLITITVLLGGIIWLREIPNRMQVGGILVVLLGITLFFSLGIRPGEPRGLVIYTLALSGFTLFGLLSREIVIKRQINTLTLTALPLAFGGGGSPGNRHSSGRVSQRIFPDLEPSSVLGHCKHSPGLCALQSCPAILTSLRNECSAQPNTDLDSASRLGIA